MEVLILAGGFGMRISEESQFKPKPSEYLKFSPWNDFTYLRYSVPIMSRIQCFLFRCLPKKLFSIINRNCVYMLLLWIARKLGL